MKRAAKGSLSTGERQLLREHGLQPSGSIKRASHAYRAVSALACAACLFATEAKAIDVASQADWNTAVAAVAAAGSGSTTNINFTSGFTLTSSLSRLQANNANVVVNITGNSQTINGASAYQGIQVNGANALTVNISNLSVTNTTAIGGNGLNGQNGYYSAGLAYGAGGGGGGGLGAGGGLLVGSGANVTLTAVTFAGNAAQGGAGGTGGSAQNIAADPVNGGNGGAGGAANNGGVAGGGGAGGTGGKIGTQGTGGSAGVGLGDGGGGGGGSGTTSSTSYTPNNAGGFGNAAAGTGGSGGDGVTNNGGIQGPGADGGFGGSGGAARGGAIYVATGGILTINDTPISGATVTGGARGSSGTGQGPSAYNGNAGVPGVGSGEAIYLSGVTLNVGVSAGTLTYANTISGTGLNTGGVTTAINKTGAGTFNLTGDNNYTGGTVVNGGTLAVNGSITSPVTVNAGGTLGGIGVIKSNVSIQSGGTFAPGNSIGTTTVNNGNLTFAAGSVYQVEADAAGNSDRINVTGAPGSATINGGTVAVLAGAGTYQASTQYTILNATGTVTGTFSSVTSNLAFLTPSLSYDTHDVFLTLTRNDIGFARVAITPNQVAAAVALQNSSVGATGDMATALTALTGLSPAQARSAYDSVGGASIVALRRAGAAFASGFGEQLNRRLGFVAAGDTASQTAAFSAPIRLAANDWTADVPLIYAQAPSSASVGTGGSERGRGFWIQAYGGAQNTSGDGNAAENRLRGVGLSGGIDSDIGGGLAVGLAVSSGTSRVSFDDLTDSGRSRGNALGAYGSYVTGPWSFKGVTSLSWNNNHMDRDVTIGSLARNAKADFDSSNLSLYAEAAYDIQQVGYVLQPIAALAYVGTRTESFNEKGADALNLRVAAETTHSTRSLLGARANYDLDRFKLQARALWAHEFGNVNAPMIASFSGAPAPGTFQVEGVELKRDSLVLGLDASGEIRKGVSLFISAQAEGNSRQLGFALFGGVSKSF